MKIKMFVEDGKDVLEIMELSEGEMERMMVLLEIVGGKSDGSYRGWSRGDLEVWFQNIREEEEGSIVWKRRQ
jgi:intein-encoded DNA endonuclease-like protein